MWISRKEFDSIRADRDKATAENRVLADQNIAQRNTIEWMCVHATRIEHERAVLVHNYMGIALPTRDLTIDKAPARAEVPIDIPGVLGQPAMFDDVGDKAAAAMGLDWDHTGKLAHK